MGGDKEMKRLLLILAFPFILFAQDTVTIIGPKVGSKGGEVKKLVINGGVVTITQGASTFTLPSGGAPDTSVAGKFISKEQVRTGYATLSAVLKNADSTTIKNGVLKNADSTTIKNGVLSTLAKDTTYRAGQFATLSTAAKMDSNRVASLDKAQTVAGVQTFSGFNTFTGANSGTATITTGDSVQVSVTGLTTAGLAVVSYNATRLAADTAATWSIWASGKLSLYGKFKKVISYWIMKK